MRGKIKYKLSWRIDDVAGVGNTIRSSPTPAGRLPGAVSNGCHAGGLPESPVPITSIRILVAAGLGRLTAIEFSVLP